MADIRRLTSAKSRVESSAINFIHDKMRNKNKKQNECNKRQTLQDRLPAFGRTPNKTTTQQIMNENNPITITIAVRDWSSQTRAVRQTSSCNAVRHATSQSD
jgi:hypothetical protein